MQRYLMLVLVAAMFLLALGPLAFADSGCGHFVDLDGDGVCDNCDGSHCNPDAPDDDGDGIPNGQDDDYSPPGDANRYGRGR
jgi:hypothetical protein